MKSQSYMTRALQARDPRYSQILGKLGYGTAEAKPVRRAAKPRSITDLRVEYEQVAGKRAFHRWSAEQLLEKIEAARSKG